MRKHAQALAMHVREIEPYKLPDDSKKAKAKAGRGENWLGDEKAMEASGGREAEDGTG